MNISVVQNIKTRVNLPQHEANSMCTFEVLYVPLRYPNTRHMAWLMLFLHTQLLSTQSLEVLFYNNLSLKSRIGRFLLANRFSRA
jgi:hypothetical protein